MPKLGATGLDVFRLCLGGNVFGWTADQSESFAILDRYADAGGNFIDTANQYSYWAPGNSGGESETILGRWMAERGNRDQIVLASKVGGEMPGLPHDLRTDTIRRSARESLERLQTDRLTCSTPISTTSRRRCRKPWPRSPSWSARVTSCTWVRPTTRLPASPR